MMRSYVFGVAAFAALTLPVGVTPAYAQSVPTTPSHPNILLIIADDLGWTDLHSSLISAGNGSKYHQTPNLDRLASQGMSFTNAYAMQNCQPSRAALMTGQYAPHNGVYNVGSLSRRLTETPVLTPPTQRIRIKPEAITVAETLKTAGYITAHVGKFHVSAGPDQIKTAHGFDFNYGGGVQGDGGPQGYFAVNGPARGWHFTNMGTGMDAFAAPYTREYIDKNLKPWVHGSDPATLENTPKHLTDAHADAALDFLKQHATGTDRTRPFFLNVGFNAVHVGIKPRPDLAAKYATLPSTDPRQKKPDYAALTEGMDEAVGRILKGLDDPNGDGNTSDSIAKNTLVVFISDNGGFLGSTANAPLRGGKGMFSEGGLRIPLIARFPGVLREGSTSTSLAHVIDLYPTFAALAGATLPDAKTHELDGVSLAGVLRGSVKNPGGRDALYWHFPGYLDTRANPCSSVVKDTSATVGGGKRYKLMYFYEDKHYELYSLTDDGSETKNLLAAAAPPTGSTLTIADDLRTSLVAWLKRVTPSYPTDPKTGMLVPPPVPFAEAHWGGPRFEGRNSAGGGDEEGGEETPKRGGKGKKKAAKRAAAQGTQNP